MSELDEVKAVSVTRLTALSLARSIIVELLGEQEYMLRVHRDHRFKFIEDAHNL